MEDKADVFTGIRTRIIQADPRTLHLLKLNARFMTHETYRRLVWNIRKDKVLTSVPFAWFNPELGGYEVLSGNHRTMAAIEAGLTEINVMVTDDPLSLSQRIAIQLSHNELAGEDDPEILKTLYLGIEDVDWKIYSGLDDERLKLLDATPIEPLVEAGLTFQPITLLFLPAEVAEVERVFDLAQKALADSKGTWLASLADYDKAMDALEAAGGAHGVKNTAMSLMIVLEVFGRHVTDLREGYLEPGGDVRAKTRPSERVPIASLTGKFDVRADTAALVNRALDKMVDRGEIAPENRERGLDKLARLYLDRGND